LKENLLLLVSQAAWVKHYNKVNVKETGENDRHTETMGLLYYYNKLFTDSAFLIKSFVHLDDSDERSV
jgi:hypothetical protein